MHRIVRLGWIPFLLALVLVVPFAPLSPALRADEASPTRLPLQTPFEPHDRWYGVYILGTKAGWAHETLDLIGSGHMAFYVLRTTVRVQVRTMGKTAQIDSADMFVFDAAPPHALLRARSLETTPSSHTDVKLRVGPDGVQATVVQGGETREMRPGPLDWTLEDYLTPSAWIRGGPEVASRLRVRNYDVSDLEADVLTMEVLSREEAVAGGVPVVIYEIQVTSDRDGDEGTTRIDAQGHVVSVEIGGFAEMRLEPEMIAKEIELGADLFLGGMAKVDRPLGTPTGVKRLVLEVEGEAASLASGPRQTVRRDGEDGPWILELGAAHGEDPPATPDEIAENTRETIDYPIHHPEVLALSRRAVGDAKTDAEKVERLTTFVGEFLRDVTLPDPVSVLDLLKTRRGDCSEHALLLTTLARAAGIPAREVGGLMYMGDRFQAFGGHAWSEVVLGGRWVPVDPTWDQVELDATHITLNRGDRDMAKACRTVGNLFFVVREVERYD